MQCNTIIVSYLKWTWLALFFYKGLAQTNPCKYLDNTYHHGDVWVDKNACDVCTCTDYGLQCMAGMDRPGCRLNNTIARAGDPACLYAFHIHLVGDVFDALDGCNKCLCTERGMQCTAKACGRNGFEQPSLVALYGECEDNGNWYRHETQWRSSDGCNTCYCYTVGNYRGGHVCTESKCPCATAANIITG